MALIKDMQGEYDGAIRLLLKHNCISDALKYAAKYESAKIHLSKVHQVRYLASHHAGMLSSKVLHGEASLTEFETVLGYLPPPDRVEPFKAAGMHDEACSILKSQRKYKEIYRVYRGQGWHEEGIDLTKEQGDGNDRAAFILSKATAELESKGRLVETTVDMLKKIRGSKSETEAKASLIYGMAIQNHTMIKSAILFYRNERILNFGEIEALNIAIARSGYTNSEKIEDLIQDLLKACGQIKTITTTLKSKGTSKYIILSQIEAFYGFQKALLGQVYSVPQSSYLWTNELLQEIDFKDVTVDADGMLQLKVEVVLTAICIRFNAFIRKWIINDKFRLVNTFNEALSKHPLHQHMISGGHLTKLISENSLFQGYIRMLSLAFDILHYCDSQLFTQNDIVKATLSALSPQATCYLAVFNFFIRSKHLRLSLHEKVKNILKEGDINFNLDKWLEAWRIGCVTKEELLNVSVLKARAERYQVAQSVFSRPPVYVLDNAKEYKHLMLLWLEACKLIREKRILDSCKIAVHNIICHIASHKTIRDKLSMSNLLHIATIYTTAIMAMYASYIAYSQYQGTFYVPSSYKRVIEVFQNMNAVLGKKNADILKSCIADVKKSKDRSKLPSEFFDLLSLILRVMIGMHDEDFNPLKHALSNEDCLKNHEAHHCLTFVLILFGNIIDITVLPWI